MINIIAAIGKNRELGRNGQLIWHLKRDMQFFKETTSGHTVVMGRKTFISIGKKLPNRRNIVLTHSNLEDVECETDFNKVLELAKNEEIFIIGGESVYKEFIDKADKLYITHIDEKSSADAFFPPIDYRSYTKKVLEKVNENGIKYEIALYERK